MERRKVPNIVGVSLDEAKEILEKANIEIEKEKKQIDIFEKSGTVVKVEPKEETSLKKNEKVVLYVSDRKPILIIILLFLLCTLFMIVRKGTISTLINTTSPVVESKTHEWTKTGMVVVTKDAKMIDELKNYEYCVTNKKSTIGCNWQITETKNAEIVASGKWYVYFRGIDVRGRRSKVSNREYVKVDNENPVVKKIKEKETENTIKVTIEATDRLSGVNSYFYKIDNQEYVLGTKTHEYKNLEANKEYKISIKVVDKVGNETIVTKKIKTKESNNITKPEEPTTTTKVTTTEEKDEVIQIINLDKVPLKFFYGNKYDLPSYYKFGPKGGEVKCIVDEVEEARNTSKLGIGKHKIVCTAYGNNGINTTVEKEVEVAVEEVEEEENDGWIWLNLHYPANSTKWEWKKLDENEEQSGEDLNWKEYTGPIRVRVEDVDKIIIRYEIDGNEIIISPDGYYVDIEPEKTSVKNGEVTKVKINYSNNVEKVEYRINNGVWQEYTSVFEVGPNTSIEARIRYLIDVYDDEGNLLLQKTKKKTASGYIGELFENVSKPSTPIKPNAPTTDPTDPSVPSTCTTCSCVSGTYEVKIVPTSRYVNNNMPVKVKIEYEDGVTKKEYKIGYDGQWQNYTGEISVNAETIIYARGSGYKEIDGCTKWVSGSTSTTLSDRTYKVYISSGTTSMDSTQKTTVSISTWRSDNLKNIEYSINGGEWTKYNKSFEVGVNTTIVAKATWEVDGVELVDQDTRTIYENKNGLRTSISTSAKRIGGSDEATVSLTTNYKADKIEYTIDNGASWNEYTKVFGVKGNTTVCAKATKTNTDGTIQTSPMVCKYVSEDDLGLVIYASAYAARKNAYVTTTIKTKYNVDTLEYSIDSGVTWNAYEGEKVKVQAGSEILARATYRGKVVSTSLKIDILPEPSVILDGPSIIGNPENTLTKSVDIEIKTKEVARDIFYRINRGSWIKYTGIFNVTSNVKIEAYYVRDEDGKTSATSTYYVQNVHVGNKPYVRIDTDPKGYLINGTQDKVKVKISGSNYNTLEYSLDGINYQPYTNEFEVTTSLIVYARATNDVGTTTTQFTIVTVNPPKVWKNLSVKIVANPDSKDLIDKDGNVKLVNETEVSLVYGSDVTSACYKVLTSGSTNLANEPCIPYTGAFKVNKNSTIYAYVQSADGKGTDVKLIDFLTLGIASPVIKVDQTSATSLVKVSIDYARSASIKKYRIDNASWIDYTGEIEVTANCTIEAMNEDMVGNQASSTRVISNIVKKPQYNALDKGDYYLIKLNYPSNSMQSSREYKWLTNGTWKKYDEHGILLIKPSAASKIVTPDGVKIKDNKGNEVIITDHYYILTVDLDKVGENLYMRWDMQKVEAPKIIVSEEEETVTSVDVAVSYNKALVSKQYRVIYDNGTDTGWIKYNGKFKVIDKGIVYAKGIDIDGNDSKVAEQRIDNIDSTGPVITITGDLVTPKQKVTLLISAKDDGEVDSLLYEVGSKKADYFKKNGKGLKNPSTITIEENGKYTFYAVDGLGNETIKEIEITNIDKTAPNIEITVLSTTVGTSTEVEINYGDAVTTLYKVGETGTYQSYTGKFTLSSYDLFNLKNQDGSLTIYAKGIDQAGNEEEVKEITYVLDLNEFATPIINASDGYPMLTSTGMILGRSTYITYDTTTTDVTNYYSIDNGVTWKEYTGGITLVSGEIIAKSVRESTGLEFTSTGKVTIPTNAVGKDTYDNNLQTSETISRNSNKMFTVNNNLYGEKIKIYTGNTVSNTSTIKMYDKNKTLLSTTETVGVLTIVEIPENTYYVEINSGNDVLEIREIELQGSRKLQEEYTPIIKINEGGWAAEKVATINYYNEEYANEYSLDNGASWKPYEEPIKLIEPTNVIARTTRENKVIGSSNFIVTKIDPTEPVIELELGNRIQLGYDRELPTYYKETPSGVTVECKDGEKVVTNTKDLEEGEHTIVCTAITGAKKKATAKKTITIIQIADIESDSILEAISNEDIPTGRYSIKVNNEVYPVHMITLDGNQHFTDNKTFGDEHDVATKEDYAQNMVIVKVNGDLTIDEGVTVSPYYDKNYGGPKGFTLYVTGKLTNKGTIDNSHGAKAEGQNVYLWKNTAGTYEYVPAVGGSGGSGGASRDGVNGVNGVSGTGRQTGGGGSGASYTNVNYRSGSGSAGTSYSGGTGGGGVDQISASSGEANGGRGGYGSGVNSNSVGSGAGNPGGEWRGNCNVGSTGTGGLLIIYADGYENHGTIKADGKNGGVGNIAPGGSSGGGSINIFSGIFIKKGSAYFSGGSALTSKSKTGGAGGNGTITYTQLQPVTITPKYLTSPNISTSKSEFEKYSITINCFSTLSKKLYSLDNGATWLEYKGSFNVDAGSVVLSKGIKTDKTETDVVTYNVPTSNGISNNAIDGDKSTSAILNANKDYIFTVSEDTIGKNLRFYLGSEPSNDATIKIYDKDNKELLSTTFVNNLTVINIPTNAYKFIINVGSKELTINEINIRKELEKNETIPSISINDVNWTSSKTIEITYPEGYKNEYSLDLGTTWNEYTEPITVETNTTIFTRVVKDEKVIGSNSFVVTSIDNVEPTIEIDIPSEFDETIYYKLPTSYSVGISGGTSNCYISDDVIKDTEKLSPGIYTIKCEVTNGVGITKSIEKNITVRKARFLKEAILQNGVIESIPTLTTSSNKTDEKIGVYKSTETNSGNPTYYFRGNVENNNLNFAGYSWKIVRINEDGTIRIVMNDGINDNAKYKYDSSAFDFYYTGSGNLVKSPLENWYNSNIGNNSNYSLNVVTGDYFCEQAIVAYKQYFADGYKTYNTTSRTSSMVAYDSYQATFKCQSDKNRHGIVPSSVGLLSYDEVLYAGGYPTMSNESYYLYSGVEYRLMSPSGNYPTLSFCYTWTVGNDGKLTIEDVKNAALILRPVINLKVNTRILDSGTGTSADPYVVK